MPAPAPDPSDSRNLTFSTDDNGKAKASCQFDAYGHTNSFADWGRLRFWNRYIRVTATGYDANQFRLGERIGEERDFHDDSPVELFVELKPARKSNVPGVD